MLPDLWTHQADLIRDVRLALRRPDHSCIAVSPTGSGKSRTMIELITGAYGKGNPTLLTVPTNEILEQFEGDLSDIPLSILRPGKRPDVSKASVVLAMSQTLNRRDLTWPLRLVLDDEIHRLTDQRVRFAQTVPDAYRVGWTATPSRLNGRLLNDYSPHLVLGPQIPTLQDLGLLVPCTTFRGPTPDLQGIKVVAGDYDPRGLEVAHRRTSLVGSVPEHWLRIARGRRTIGFTTSREHSADLVAACLAAGIRAEAVDGETPAGERAAALGRLRDHEIDILWNCALFVEGLSLNAVDCICLCYSTLSLAKYLQSIGRGLRIAIGKSDLYILDFGGNSFDERHGLVDQERDWLDSGKVKRQADALPSLHTCGACLAIYATPPPCPRCGAAAATANRGAPQTVDVELRPVSKAEIERQKREASKDVPPRPCPSWAKSNEARWIGLERVRQARGYELGNGDRWTGWTAATWRRAESKR